VAAIAAFALLLWVRRGDVRAARRAAAAEARVILEPGERVEREVNVSQRHWYHYFREMHGVLVATDRRLLYVGVEPEALLPSREFVPQAFEEHAYAWDTLTTLVRERVFFNTARGAVLRAREGSQVFAVSSAEQDRLAEIASYLEMRGQGVRAQLERERQARIAAEFEARKPKYHVVQQGEALISIANLYGVTPEQLREWNNLPSDRIRVGQSLMVKPQT
jgi:transposase-like protein